MQSKLLGTSGELRVAHELYKRGYACFAELGDTSRIDLIAAIGPRLVRIQVKSLSLRRGAYELTNRKKAKGYEFLYGVDDVDVFALYCTEHDCVAWVKATDFIVEGKRSELRLRPDLAANGQSNPDNLLANYLDFNRAFGLGMKNEL